MERKSLFRFFVRSLLQLCAFLLGQLSRTLGARIDSTTFLSAFSFIDNDGKRYSLGPWVGAEDGIVVDTPCGDSSEWGVDVPSRVYDDTPLSGEADPNGEQTEQSTTQPCEPSTSSLHPIIEISEFNSQILDEQVEHKRHGRWNGWFDHLEDQSRFIPSQYMLFELDEDGLTGFDVLRNQFYKGPGKPLRGKGKGVSKGTSFHI